MTRTKATAAVIAAAVLLGLAAAEAWIETRNPWVYSAGAQHTKPKVK